METIQKFVWAAHEVVLAYHDGNLAAAIRELDTAVKEVVSLAREFRPIDDTPMRSYENPAEIE